MPQASYRAPITLRQDIGNTTDCVSDPTIESLAAALVEVVYPVVLRHEDDESWIDLELALWRVLTETVHDWGRAAGLLHCDNKLTPP
jgi:hypothetical protein